MTQSLARRPRPANFAENLSYTAGAAMYFPAGIPFVALIALIVWNTQQNKERERTNNKAQPKVG